MVSRGEKILKLYAKVFQMIFISDIAEKSSGIESIILIEADNRKQVAQMLGKRGWYWLKINENLSFKMAPDTFGKQISANELPENVFMLVPFLKRNCHILSFLRKQESII